MDWRAIETAPRDSNLVDLWVIDATRGASDGWRETDCCWRDNQWQQHDSEAGDYFTIEVNGRLATHWMIVSTPSQQ